MRLERISAHEIKAHLSAEDIKELGIKDASRLDRGAADMILGIAKAELDFKCEKNNCEIYTEPDGGGYVFTIKASDAGKSRAPRHKTVLCFNGYTELQTACLFLLPENIISSELCAEDTSGGKTYYLIIEFDENGHTLDGKPYRISSVCELCSCAYTDKNAFFYYISEHSYKLIEKNAVYDIAKNEKKW